MFKKLVYYLVIFSIFMADFAGWGCSSTYAMDFGEQKQSISVHLPDPPEDALRK